MKSLFIVLVVPSIVAFFAAGASAQVGLLVSGQTALATIDTDGDGPDSQDCLFTGILSSIVNSDPMTATLDITGVQSNSPALRACLLSFTAFTSKATDESSNYASAYVYDANGPSGFNYPGSLPFVAELVDETANPDIADPVGLNDPRDYAEFQDEGEDQTALGVLCSANGSPAAQVRGGGGPNLLVDLNLYPNASSPTHLEVPGPPLQFELASGGFQSFKAYVPVTSDGHLTVSNTTAPNALLVDIDLGALPQCAGGHGAPTATEGGLIALALSLLAMGTWALSRRDSFARSVSF